MSGHEIRSRFDIKLKLVGFLLLGGFTLALNDVNLPLGFTVYLLFFKKNKEIQRIKHIAALLGLLLFISQFAMPLISRAIEDYTYPTTIEHVNLSALDTEGLGNLVHAMLPIDEAAEVNDLDGIISHIGEYYANRSFV